MKLFFVILTLALFAFGAIIGSFFGVPILGGVIAVLSVLVFVIVAAVALFIIGFAHSSLI